MNKNKKNGIILIILGVTISVLIILVVNGLIKNTQKEAKINGQENSKEESKSNIIEETQKTPIEVEKSYVGYYADIDKDGVVDGIIYADLAVGNTGLGYWSDKEKERYRYTIPTKSNDLREYYVSKREYTGNFGTKDVLSPIEETGEERFYVMALKDIDGEINKTSYAWYTALYDIDNANDNGTGNDIKITSSDFGTGKENTRIMIEKWNSKAYGEQNQDNEMKDLWGAIQEQVNRGWFVPSRGEWVAFAGELKASEGRSLKIKEIGCNRYWSSSKVSGRGGKAYFIRFETEDVDFSGMKYGGLVRLSVTF